MSARNKLVLAIGILFVAMVTIMSVSSFMQINQSSTRDYREKLAKESFLVATALEGQLDTYFTALESLAASIEIVQGKPVVDERLFDLLVDYKQRMAVLNFFIGLPDGTTYDASNHGLIKNFNAKQKQREWYLKGMAGTGRIITNPFMASTGDLSMVLAIPLKHQGKVAAVLSMSLKMSQISEYVNQLSEEKNLFVSRSDGFLMAASYPDFVGKNLFELRPSYRQYAGERSSEHSYSVPEKGEFFVVAAQLPTQKWTVWAWASWQDINATSNATIKTNLLSALVLIVLGIGAIYWLITRLIYLPMGGEPKQIEALVNRLANGDLSQVPPNCDNCVGVYRSTLLMANKLKAIISDINHSSHQLSDTATHLDGSSQKVDNSAKEQLLQLEQVATAMNQMTATVAEVAQNAVEASRSSGEAGNNSATGLAVVREMNDAIHKLVEEISGIEQVISAVHAETENVAGILDVIRNIADQTNLLALNAAIEAARAGENGRGFAVVADEVRNLATKTQSSTDEIQTMIESLQQQASQSVRLMQNNAENAKTTLNRSNDASLALQGIQQEVSKIEDMNSQIATAAEQQSQVAAEINENVVVVKDIAISTAEDVKENLKISDSLGSVSQRLTDSVSIFRI